MRGSLPMISDSPARQSGPRSPERALRTARLASGLIMMTFVAMHLSNLALSLISIGAADAGLPWLTEPWKSVPGATLLYGAAAVHITLVLRTLYLKRTLRMPAREAAQIVLGVLIPLLIAEHVIGVRVYRTMTGTITDYEFVARSLWVDSPLSGLKQVTALLVIWAHGCLGLYFWLRYRDWYATAAPFLLIGAVLFPVLALLGFVDAGRAVAAMPPPPVPDAAMLERIVAAVDTRNVLLGIAYVVFVCAVALTLLLRALRFARSFRNLIEVRYEDGRVVRVPKGATVLEASRIGGIPHYSICGGKGRCSTCRVSVTAGLADLPEPGLMERMTLERIHAGPGVRLACQIRPNHDITVQPLLAVARKRPHAVHGWQDSPGWEREIVVLFCDIRGFTALAGRRLPYDVVFLLNRYFETVGHAVEQAGGRLDKFIGDGAMALFGLDSPTQEASRQALTAAAAILAALDRLSDELVADISEPIKVAIGIHAGQAIVGEMGYGGVRNMTAIGDAVNVASRLETVAKQFDAAIVVSDTVVTLSGLDFSAYEARRISIRGGVASLNVRVVPQDAVPVAGFADADVEVHKA